MADLERIKGTLDIEQPEERVQRMWRRIDAARDAPKRKPYRSRIALGTGVTALACAAAFYLFYTPPAPLMLSTGQGLPQSLSTATRTAFSDGSTITTGDDARVEVLESSGRTVGLALRRGRARFDIVPGGPRAWRVECGAVTVEVVGTAFTIERERSHVHVVVHRGAVVVRGEGVADRVQRLHAGEEVDVGHAPVRPVAFESLPAPPRPRFVPPPPPLPPEDIVPEEGLPEEIVEAPEPHHIDPSWRRAAIDGEYHQAFEALGDRGVSRAAARATSADELQLLADVARLSGHPAQSVAPLTRIVEDHADDPRAALAAYTLGSLYGDALRNPARAEAMLARSLQLGLPSALREPAFAKRVEALARMRSPELQRVANDYLEMYPQGRHRATVERWRDWQ